MKMRRWTLSLLLLSTTGLVGCQMTGGHNLPPASRLAEPGPGVGGPGPGVIPPPIPPGAAAGMASPMSPALAAAGAGYASPAGGVQLASYGGAECVGDSGAGAVVSRQVQVLFGRPEAMQVQWDVSGSGQFDSSPMVTPGRQNFQQGGIYRLKLTNVPGTGREGVELYPTLEIGPPSYRTLAYLAHNAIPIQLTEEDFDQVLAGNFVTKVIYLPDPEFQGLAVADVATLVSTRLDPGLDPIEEASHKGAILAILRVGNKDLEVPGVETASHVSPAGFAGGRAAGGTDCPPSSPGAGHGHLGRLHGCLHGNCPIGGYAPNVMNAPPGGMPADLISGVNVPQYGMPHTGTPIGLPGPPHIPLGVPAGLQKHVIVNHTKMHIPDPVEKVKINVKQRPGLSYPHPVSRAWVTEDTMHPNVHFGHHGYGQAVPGQVQNNCGPGGMPQGGGY